MRERLYIILMALFIFNYIRVSLTLSSVLANRLFIGIYVVNAFIIEQILSGIS